VCYPSDGSTPLQLTMSSASRWVSSRSSPQIVKYPHPENEEEARLSLPHIVASAISGESMFIDTFTPQKVRDSKLVAQRRKVHMDVHPEWGLA
jgi:2-methylcitrate dehydratase PrpD